MKGLLAVGFTLLAAFPATSNYKLNSYGFGSGGTANTHTATYSLEGISGELSSGSTSGTHTIKPGFIQTEQANVPQLASLDNNGGQYYNKLHFVIDNQNNPSDATFLIAVSSSSDPACSSLCYLQPDGTLSTTLNLTDYQTYSAWGGASGGLIIGLLPSTTYDVKLKATQGQFTESAYGPTTSQATAAPSLTFSLSTSTQPSPPYSVDLGTLDAGTVNTTSSTINTAITTNGTSGGDVYINGQYGGLKSGSTGYQINALSGNLDSSGEGFGAQTNSYGQTSGGPLNVDNLYSGTGNIVGIVNGTYRSLYYSTAPIVNGNATLVMKAKASSLAVAARDYQETLTFVAAGNF